MRREVLRIPLGLDFTEDELEYEEAELHFVFRENNGMVAVGLFRVLDDKTLKMRQVAVKSDQQGKGIGKRLILGMEDWARTHQYRRIELHARSSALPFYLGMNYQMEGDIFEEVGIPHYFMFKQIDGDAGV